MEWIAFPDARLPVFGLPWFDAEAPALRRLPSARREQYRPPVWSLAQSPAGGRIRFATDADAVALRLDYGSVGHMNNMHRIGQHAVDCYVDGVLWSVTAPVEGEPKVEKTLFSGVERAWRQIDLYLPLYHPVTVEAVGLADGAGLRPPAPFTVDKPVVFYGSSITQGGCASHSGNSYQAFVCRRLNVDHVNLGFSGNGRGEPAVAQTVADIDAACYVIDYCQNCPTLDELRETYGPFLAVIRERRPDTPILCITAITNMHEVWNKAARERMEGMRSIIREAVEHRIAAGDQRIQVIEGPDLLGRHQTDGIIDMSHPNDLGFHHMADGLERPLAGALGL